MPLSLSVSLPTSDERYPRYPVCFTSGLRVSTASSACGPFVGTLGRNKRVGGCGGQLLTQPPGAPSQANSPHALSLAILCLTVHGSTEADGPELMSNAASPPKACSGLSVDPMKLPPQALPCISLSGGHLGPTAPLGTSDLAAATVKRHKILCAGHLSSPGM